MALKSQIFQSQPFKFWNYSFESTRSGDIIHDKGEMIQWVDPWVQRVKKQAYRIRKVSPGLKPSGICMLYFDIILSGSVYDCVLCLCHYYSLEEDKLFLAHQVHG